MEPDRELLTVVTHLVNAYCPTLPMLYVLGIACAEYLTQRDSSPAVEVAARKILDRAVSEAGSARSGTSRPRGAGSGTADLAPGRPRPARPPRRRCQAEWSAPQPPPRPAPQRSPVLAQHVRQCRAFAVDGTGRTAARCGRSNR